ncbi:MAG: NINE protein [Propionibacteriaceae bacterium]|nr:NINE protein [Propionibacteriaceae bacterium]
MPASLSYCVTCGYPLAQAASTAPGFAPASDTPSTPGPTANTTPYPPGAASQYVWQAPGAYPTAGAPSGTPYQPTSTPFTQQTVYGQGYVDPNYGAPQYAPQAYGTALNPMYVGMPVYAQQKSKVAAGVLGILLGGLGIHNFYLGYKSKAVAQLLLSLVGWIVIIGPLVAGIWGLIEGVLILTGSIGTDADGVPLKD